MSYFKRIILGQNQRNKSLLWLVIMLFVVVFLIIYLDNIRYN